MKRPRLIDSHVNKKLKKESKKELAPLDILPAQIKDISLDFPPNLSDMEDEIGRLESRTISLNKPVAYDQSLDTYPAKKRKVEHHLIQGVIHNDSKVNIILGNTSSDSEIEIARKISNYNKPTHKHAVDDKLYAGFETKQLASSLTDNKRKKLEQPMTKTKPERKKREYCDDSEFANSSAAYHELPEHAMSLTNNIENKKLTNTVTSNSSKVLRLNVIDIKENDLFCCDKEKHDLPSIENRSLNLSENEFALYTDNKVKKKVNDLEELKFGLVSKILEEKRAQQSAILNQRQAVKEKQISVLLNREIWKLTPEASNENDGSRNLPTISYQKLLNSLEKLEEATELSPSEKRIKACTKLMNPTAYSSWRSIAFLARAIKDSLLARKWNNVNRLLILLIKHYNTRYASYIRNVVHIIKLLNPRLQNSEYKEHFDQIKNLQKIKSRKGEISINIV